MGDLVFVTDNPTMIKGVNRNISMTIDIDDKITTIESAYNIFSVINYILLSSDCRIGEISNVSTCYLNKQTTNPEQIKRYDDYVSLLSVLNGKEIDFPKTGIRWNVPYHIAKYARPLPYFMKYAGNYYKNLKHFSKAQTNLNKLCWNIEKWEKQFKYSKHTIDISHLLIDESIEWDKVKYNKIKELYKRFTKEMSDATKQNALLTNYDNYENYFSDMTKWEVINTDINWGEIYERYVFLAKTIVLNPQELANYGVEICYRLYPKRSTLFAWVICEEGLFLNLANNKFDNLQLPQQTTDTSETEYLGKYYKLIKLFS
jgi:hypothetical protein